MTDENPTAETRRQVEAWTAAQWAAAADHPSLTVLDAEAQLDTAVAEGYAVRLTQGAHSYYVAGSLAEVLESFGALPVTADEVGKMRQRIYDAIRAARGGSRG